MKDTVLAKLSWSFAKKYRITLLLWLVILVFGGLSYTTILKREGFPPINLPIGVVQGTYFVEDSNTVDAEVVQPISEAVATIESVDTFQATSGANFYTVIITFQDDVSAADGVKEVEAAIAEQTSLPQEASSSVSAIEPAQFDNKYNLLLAVYENKDSSYQSLFDKAERVATELSEETDIASAESKPIIEQVQLPGSQQSAERQTAINKIGLRENDEIVFYPAVTVGVVKEDDVDDIQLSETVTSTLQQLESENEFADTNTNITADFATTINQQISSLQSSLIGGLIAVIIIALLLISWRAALVIALFMPTVMAATFGGLQLLGLTLNTITLFATILTLGLFVDDATIIVEAIDAEKKKKKGHKEVIKAAISRVGLASLAGTLTTILVFTPMLFISGILGDFIKLLPITVITALAASLLIALILVPFISRPLVLGKKKRFATLDKLSLLLPVEKWLALKLGKLPLLNRDNPKKGRIVTTLLVGFSVLAVAGAGFFASRLSLDIFPRSKDSNVLQANVEFSGGTTIPEAELITNQLDERLTLIIGENLDYVTYISANERSANIEIGLTPYTERDLTSHNIINDLESAGSTLSGASLQYSQRDAGPPAEDFPFQMHIYAAEDRTLASAAEEVSSFIEATSFNLTGEVVSVAEVITANTEAITRTDRGRYVSIEARFDNTAVASGAVIELESIVSQEFDESRLREMGLSVRALDFDVSQESQNAESFNSVGIGLVLALVLMYVLLILLFNSFSQPLLIFLAIPFSLFGVFFGLWITDNSLSFFVMLGLLGLIGIVVNNTILLTEYANQERDAGADRHTAISNAVKDRFRPLVTTTLTTVFALLPLALSDPFWQALAYTLIFGMISSTTLIIISFPYYYLFFERIRDWKNTKFPALK